MTLGWQVDPALRRALRTAVIGFLAALLGILGVFAGQGFPNRLIENVGAVIALAGLAITSAAVIAGFVLALRALWRRSTSRKLPSS